MAPEDRGAAFAALRQHPDFEAWMTHDPDALTARGCRDLAGLLGLLLVGAVLSVLSVAFLPQLALVPLALVLIGAVALVAQLLRGTRRNRSPLERWPACVVDVQARFATDAGAAGTSTYAATLEREDGTVHVLHAAPATTAPLRPGLYGVAFTRGTELVLFVPLIS